MGMRSWWRRRQRPQTEKAGTSCRVDCSDNPSREDIIARVQSRGVPHDDAVGIVDKVLGDGRGHSEA